MSQRTLAAVCEAAKTEIDDVQRELARLHLQNAWQHFTHAVWALRHGLSEDDRREMSERIEDLVEAQRALAKRRGLDMLIKDIKTLDDVYRALRNDFEWIDGASEDKAIAITNVVDKTCENIRDALAELHALDAEYVGFANGSHGHLRVKAAIKKLEGK